MEIANITLSLGGDHGNTINKWRVTAAEIAVLRAIHGEDSVRDIELQGAVSVSHRAERERLIAIYGAAKFPDQKPIVESLFPGIAARLFERLSELELDESFFKATARMVPASAASVAEPGTAEAHVEGLPAVTEDPDDGIDDMPDAPADGNAGTALFG